MLAALKSSFSFLLLFPSPMPDSLMIALRGCGTSYLILKDCLVFGVWVFFVCLCAVFFRLVVFFGGGVFLEEVSYCFEITAVSIYCKHPRPTLHQLNWRSATAPCHPREAAPELCCSDSGWVA